MEQVLYNCDENINHYLAVLIVRLVNCCITGSDSAMEFNRLGLCYGWISAIGSTKDNICWWCSEATESRFVVLCSFLVHSVQFV